MSFNALNLIFLLLVKRYMQNVVCFIQLSVSLKGFCLVGLFLLLNIVFYSIVIQFEGLLLGWFFSLLLGCTHPRSGHCRWPDF